MPDYPTFHCDIVFGGGLGPTTPPVHTLGAGGAGNETFTQIPEFTIVSGSIRRGRQSELDRFAAGTLTLTLRNEDRRYDPENTAGPYYPNLRPMRRIRLRVLFDISLKTLFDGFIDGWPQAHDSPFGSVITITATDAFKVLANADAQTGGLVFDTGKFDSDVFGTDASSVTFPEELSGARVNRVLDLARWPDALRDIDEGQSLLSTTGPSGNALPYLQDVETSEDGFLHMAATGKVTFRDRHQRYTLARMTTSQATFSDDGSDWPYERIETDYSDRFVYNDVRRTADGSSTTHRAVDSDSVDEFGKRTDDKTLLVESDAVAKDLADSFLIQHAEPRVRLERLVLRPDVHDTAIGSLYLFDVALNRELLDRVTVEHTPASTGTQTVRQLWVEGIEHSFAGKRWETSLYLSPANTDNYLVFDSATLGKFDTAKFAA